MITKDMEFDEVVRGFLELYAVVHDKNTRDYYRFDGKIYREVDLVQLKQLFYKYVEETLSAVWTSALEGYFLRVLETFSKYRELKPRANRVSVSNGTINLETGELYQWDSSDDLKSIIEAKFDPDAEAPTFLKFLLSVCCGNQKMVNTLIEMIGYVLSNQIGANKLFLLVGPGANGKSTFLKLLQSLLSYNEVTSFLPQELCRKQFYIHALKDTRLNLVHELPESESIDSLFNNAVKSIATGDTLEAEVKGGKNYRLELSTKLVFASNYFPSINRVPSEATLRRYLILPFNASFSGKSADPDIFKKMMEEKSGILRYAVEGYKRLKNNGFRFSYEEDSTRIIHHEIHQRCPIFAFVCEYLEIAPEEKTPNKVIYAAFCRWCQESKINVSVDKTAFAAEVKRSLDCLRIPYETKKSNSERHLIGVRIKDARSYIPKLQVKQEV